VRSMTLTNSLIPAALVIMVSGCVQSGVVRYVPVSARYEPVSTAVQYDVQADLLLPPLPRFLFLADCEQAYGVSACGSGVQVYAGTGIAPPHHAHSWFIPYHYRLMTGVLMHAYFTPPGRYVYGIPYRTYVSSHSIEHYRKVTPVVMSRYYAAPPSVRENVLHRGPVSYGEPRHPVMETPATAHRFVRASEPSSASGSRTSASRYRHTMSSPLAPSGSERDGRHMRSPDSSRAMTALTPRQAVVRQSRTNQSTSRSTSDEVTSSHERGRLARPGR
jgi:hypothetical protein